MPKKGLTLNKEEASFMVKMAKVYKMIPKQKQQESVRTISRGYLRYILKDQPTNRHERELQRVYKEIMEHNDTLGICQVYDEQYHYHYKTFLGFAMAFKLFAAKNRFDEEYPEYFV